MTGGLIILALLVLGAIFVWPLAYEKWGPEEHAGIEAPQGCVAFVLLLCAILVVIEWFAD